MFFLNQFMYDIILIIASAVHIQSYFVLETTEVIVRDFKNVIVNEREVDSGDECYFYSSFSLSLSKQHVVEEIDMS